MHHVNNRIETACLNPVYPNTRRAAAQFNQRVEPMTRSAVTLLFQSTAAGALLVMAHPCRYTEEHAMNSPRHLRAYLAREWRQGNGRPRFLCLHSFATVGARP